MEGGGGGGGRAWNGCYCIVQILSLHEVHLAMQVIVSIREMLKKYLILTTMLDLSISSYS